MSDQRVRLFIISVLAFMISGLSVVSVSAQSAATDVGRGQGSVSHTAWGDPDIQGIWTSSGATPFERPTDFQGRETLSNEEVAQFRTEADERSQELLNAPARRAQAGASVGAYNDFWMDRGARSNRTSMVIDPPNGRLPSLTPEGQKARNRWLKAPGGRELDDTWEDRHIWERCVTRGGMPNAMFPRSYNNNMHVFQSPGYVVMLLEQVHEVRVVPLDDRPHLPENITQWNGDARGYWDGDTLVVTTTNLDHRVSGLQPWSLFHSHEGSGDGLTLVERFTRTSSGELEYEVEVTDPQMYTRPWTVSFPFSLSSDLMFEYACHEGNEGMVGILAGGRAEDAEAAAAR